MAIGYTKIIYRNTYDSLNQWISFLKAKFKNYDDSEGYLTILNLDGEYIRMSIADIYMPEEQHRCIVIRNSRGSGMVCTLSYTKDESHAIEEYCMDELIEEEEYTELFDLIHKRYLDLFNKGLGIALIFDRDGYSEDYITVTNQL